MSALPFQLPSQAPTGLPHLSAVQWITPGVLLAVAAIGLVYVYFMWGPGRDGIPEATAPTRRETLYFLGFLFALYLSIGSPLGALAMGYSFTSHMFQHMVAAMAVPPFLIRALPTWAWRRILRPRWVAGPFRFLVRPVIAIAVFNGVFALMILPSIVDAMVASMPVMIAWHASLMVVGVFMWWPVMSPLEEFPPLHLGLQVLYLFADGIPMLLPLALVLLDTSPLYTAAYTQAHSILGMGLVGDQQLGAAICLVTVHVVYGAMLGVRFVAWSRTEPVRDADLELNKRPGPRASLRVVR